MRSTFLLRDAIHKRGYFVVSYVVSCWGHCKKYRAALGHRAGVVGLAPLTQGDSGRRRVNRLHLVS